MHAIALDNQPIPMPPTSLVGREDDLARLTDLLLRPDVRLVTLLGPGGVGKTRLALQVAHDIDRDRIGEVHVVLLANAPDADAALPAIARTLGVAQTGPLPLDRLIIDHIGGRRMLLVLDNVEQMAEHLTFVSTLVGACPNLTVLVTSRVMLRLSAEHVFPVEPLSTTSRGPDDLAPATALFVERARAVRPDLAPTEDNIRAIDEICRAVDGLPLAIELAAARTRFLPPAALRDRLTERLDLLVGGPRDAPERHRTLRATLTWSHDLLSPAERALFRRLAVFENGAPYDAVDPVCNASGDLGANVEEILAALVDHSLVRIIDAPAASPRVRMLHTVRQFAREQLDVSGETDAVRRAHARWFANLVIDAPDETWRTGTAELRAWVLQHVHDVDNFSVALHRLMEQRERSAAVGMVTGLIVFWLELGHLRDGRAWIQRVMPFAHAASPDIQARFYRLAAGIAFTNDDLDEAMALARRALELSEHLGQPRLIANCLNLLGALHWRLGQPEEGERLQRAAIATIRQTPDQLAGALFTAQIASHLLEAGDLDRAEPLLREALPLIEQARPGALPLIQAEMAHLALRRGDLDRAGDFVERSLAYHREPPHRHPLAFAELLVHTSELAVRRGVAELGARLLGAAEAICELVGFTLDGTMKLAVNRVDALVVDAVGKDRYAVEKGAGTALSIPEVIETALRVARMRTEAAVPSASVEDGSLTPREREVLALLAEGKSNAAIADALFISERTVTTHLTRLYAKLDVSTRSEAIAHAMRMGLVHPS